MHEIKVKVIGLEIFQRGVDGGFDVVRMMAVVPKLGSDEDLIARDAAVLDAPGDGWLSTIA